MIFNRFALSLTSISSPSVTRQSVELIPIGSANATAPAVLASAVHYGNRLILPMAAADE